MCNEYRLPTDLSRIFDAFAEIKVPFRWADAEPPADLKRHVFPKYQTIALRPVDPADPWAGFKGFGGRTAAEAPDATGKQVRGVPVRHPLIIIGLFGRPQGYDGRRRIQRLLRQPRRHLGQDQFQRQQAPLRFAHRALQGLRLGKVRSRCLRATSLGRRTGRAAISGLVVKLPLPSPGSNATSRLSAL